MRQVVAALGMLLFASLALGPRLMEAQCNGCEGDSNGDDRVTIDELVTAVNRALSGCGDRVDCEGDGDCDPDEVCRNGTCVGLPDPCDSDADCDSDETCVDGNCE